MIAKILLICFFVLSVICLADNTEETLTGILETRLMDEDGYAIILDAGSTGSRAFIFNFKETWKSTFYRQNASNLGPIPSKELVAREVESQPGMKIKKGISAFADAAAGALASHLLPIFIHASQLIPAAQWQATQVHVMATAGMRVLSPHVQTRIWEEVLRLNDNPQNPFHVSKDRIGTIDGSDEAYYAVLASNFIAGTIDALLHRTRGTQMVGALDMGGGSTQLIFYHSEPDSDSEARAGTGAGAGVGAGTGSTAAVEGQAAAAVAAAGEDVRKQDHTRPEPAPEPEAAVGAGDFWSHSWLNMGAETVRARLRDALIEGFRYKSAGNGDGDSNDGDTNNDDEPTREGAGGRESGRHASLSTHDVQERRQQALHIDTDSTEDEAVLRDLRSLPRVGNPCAQRGFVERAVHSADALANANANTNSTAATRVWEHYQDDVTKVGLAPQYRYLLVGTGRPQECLALLRTLLWPDGSCSGVAASHVLSPDASRPEPEPEPCYLAGVRHPRVKGPFYGMSVYFYANDAVRTLLGLEARAQSDNATGECAASSDNAGESSGSSSASSTHSAGGNASTCASPYLKNWPRPSLSELRAAAERFCQTAWPGKPLQRHSRWRGLHAYSGSAQLPHRCFETLYMTVLLGDAFGFPLHDSAVTYALDVKGREVEWTLGFALAKVRVGGAR